MRFRATVPGEDDSRDVLIDLPNLCQDIESG